MPPRFPVLPLFSAPISDRMLPKKSDKELSNGTKATQTLQNIQDHATEVFRGVMNKNHKIGFSAFKNCVATIDFTIGDSDIYHLLEKMERNGDGYVDVNWFMRMFVTQYEVGPLFVAFDFFCRGETNDSIWKKHLRNALVMFGITNITDLEALKLMDFTFFNKIKKNELTFSDFCRITAPACLFFLHKSDDPKLRPSIWNEIMLYLHSSGAALIFGIISFIPKPTALLFHIPSNHTTPTITTTPLPLLFDPHKSESDREFDAIIVAFLLCWFLFFISSLKFRRSTKGRCCEILSLSCLICSISMILFALDWLHLAVFATISLVFGAIIYMN